MEKFLKKHFKYLKYVVFSHNIDLKERQDLVDHFNDTDSIKLMILSPKIGGLGLNLASANVVIMFDHGFNPMSDL